MNGPLSDGNENVIDIFVLSTSSAESPVQAGSLEQPGYRITFFTDSNELFETLRSGKPNLLICDSVTFHEDAYELCRNIKADFDLWMIPVLIVTEASNLADLLHVLDCNADNFISYPYDPSYLTSLIEGMLSTPVERQTPEQIKTQFKIQHDDRMFVVTADRRRLLEFLLSSFEIAVNRSGDLAQVREDNTRLAAILKKSESLARDQARTLETLNATLRQNEQQIANLIADARNKDRLIAGRTEEVQQLTKEIESYKPLLTAAEEQLRRLSAEAEDRTQQHAAEAGGLRQELTAVTGKLSATDAELAETKNTLAMETTLREDTEKNLAEMTALQEQTEKTARALTLECEQLRISLAAEKNRVQSAELETKSLFQAKAESEQDLTRIIDELKNTAKQQGADLHRQKEELDDGKNRIINLEIQLGNLRGEKEKLEAESRASADLSARAIEDLQQDLSATRATLGEREHEVESLRADLGETKESRDATARELQLLTAELSSLKTAFADEKEQRYAAEARLNAEIREREAALQTLQDDHQSARTELDEHRSTLSQVKNDLDAALTKHADLEREHESATARIRDLESELRQASGAAGEAGQRTASLSGELEQVKAELENSRGRFRDAESLAASEKREKERIAAELESAVTARSDLESSLETATGRCRELESALESASAGAARAGEQVRTLSGEMEQARAELENSRDRFRSLELLAASEKQEKERIAAELESAVTARSGLEGSLEAAAGRIRELESALKATATDSAHTGKQVHALADELEQVKAELENSRRQRHSVEEALAGEKRENERVRSELQRERASMETALEKESTLSDTVRELTARLDASNARRAGLEEQVHTLVREKQLAEDKAISLSSEIDQARTALADEWEDHMNAQERLVVAEKEKQQMRQSMQHHGNAGPDTSGKRELVVKAQDLPIEIRKAPQSLAITPKVPEEPAVPRITNVADLFEEEETPGEDAEADAEVEAPIVSIVQEPSDAEGTVAGIGFGAAPGFDPEPESGDEDLAPEEETESDDEDTEEEPESSGESREEAAQGFAFNRAQWFDLLKWAHHSGTLSQEQRMQIVRMGRLIQKGRRLTHKQEEQVMEMISLVQAQGYRFT